MRLRHPLGLLAAGFLGASCLPGGKLPPATQPAARGNATLRPTEASLPPDEGPLKVLFASPEGDEVEAPLPTIVFSRSMHRLGAPPGEPTVEASVEPRVEGQWRWVGSRALQFSPRGGFNAATSYRVEVRPGLRSLDGQEVKEPIQLSFATARLKLLDISLGDRVDGVIQVRFNGEVDPGAFLKAFSLRDEEKKEIPFVFDQKKPSSYFELRPKKRWPEDMVMRAAVEPIRGTAGPLGMTERQERALSERSVRTVERLSCNSSREAEPGVCEEDTSIEISLSDAMMAGQLAPLIKIEPRVAFKLEHYGRPNEPSSSFSLRAPFKLGVPYRVTVQSSPKRRRGQPGLDAGATLSFVTAPPPPDARLGVHGTFLRPGWTGELAASVEGVASAHFSATPVAFADVLAKFAEDRAIKPRTEGQRVKDFTDSKEEWAAIKLGELMPGKPGPVLLSGEWQGKKGKGSQSHLFQRTELGMSIALSPEGSQVWVTRLATGAAVASAEVEIHDTRGNKIEAKTDAQGLARLDLAKLAQAAEPAGHEDRWHRSKLLVVARSGDDWLYQTTYKPNEPRTEGFLFSDRDIYRPGETIYVKGVVRKGSTQGPQTLEGSEVQLTIRVPEQPDLIVAKKVSPWGTFWHEIQLPSDVPPRSVRVELSAGRGQLASIHPSIRHVREVSFKVSASLDRAHYLPGDALTCQGNASYLYGGSMKSMRYSARLSQKTGGYQVPGLDRRFHVGSEGGHAWISSVVDTKSGALGAGGSYKESFVAPDAGSPRQLRCGVSVTDPGQQVVEEEATAWLHPASFYVAMARKSEGHETSGKGMDVELLAVSPEGQRRAEKVQVELKEERRTPSKKKNEEDKVEHVSVGTCSTTTGAEAVRCSVRVPQRHDTWYTVEATASDEKGRKAASSFRFRTESKPKYEPPRPAPPPRPEPPPKPPLLAVDKASYRPGDTVRVSLNPEASFGQGLAWVTREGIFTQKVLNAGDRSFEFAATEGMAPGASVGVRLLAPLPDEAPDRRLEHNLEHGGVRVNVERPPRTLQVAVLPSKTEAAPGDTIDVDVSVSDRTGKAIPAEVTLYAVNEGMLLLSGYQTPELSRHFNLDGQDLVVFGETRHDIGWVEKPVKFGTIGHGFGTGSGMGFGSGHGRLGGASGGPPPLRKDFRPTPLFLPSLETDDKGHARASFKLPDSLTSYRIMAVALSKADRFGNAESTVKVSLPAQIRPVVPMAIRAGDRFDVPAVAANNTGQPLDLVASVDLEGFALTSGQASRPVRLEPGSSERVTFALEARRPGPGKLTFRIKGEGGSDAAEIPAEILSPASLEASAVYGKTSQAVEEQVADLGAIRPDVGYLEVTLSSSPVAGLGPGLEQLVEYPYGCTEQTVSRLVPLLSLRDLARALGVALPADVDRESQKAVERLLKNRQSSGQFGLWAHSTPSPWITTYATWGLAEAHRRGVSVAPAVFSEAEKYLGDVAIGWARGESDAASACFALDVLADLPGASDTTRSHALLVARQIAAARQGVPDFGRSLLLHAMARLGAGADELAPLIKDVEKTLHLDGPLARAVERSEWFHDLLDSRVRSSALALRALLAAAPGHPMLEPLALGLVADRGPKGWRTTQETAWALLALDAFRRTRDAGPLQASAKLGGRELLSVVMKGPAEHRAKLPLGELLAGGGALRFDASGGGTLHYQARLSYAPVKLPADPIFAGIEVSRSCRAILNEGASGPPQGHDFKVGQWVSCEVEVVSPSPRRFVAIDAPIPGGFELADPSLSGTPSAVKRLYSGHHSSRELRADRAVFFVDHLSAGAHYFSYAARAMTSGQFILPPARARRCTPPRPTAAPAPRPSPSPPEAAPPGRRGHGGRAREAAAW